MSKVATDFGDPQSSTKLLCEALLREGGDELLERRPALDGLEVGTRLPTSQVPGRLLVVRAGVWTDYQPPVTAENTLRLSAWAPEEDDAYDVSSWFHGRLLAYDGDADVVSYRFSEGPRRGKDPDYGTPTCTFTIRARMHPQLL
jgi:hypothetical protein